MNYLAMVTFLLCLMVAAQGAAAQDSWLERTRNSAESGVDGLALWLDGYFGDAQYEADTLAKSYARVIQESVWSEHDDIDYDVKLRGTLYLPRVNERFSLIVGEDSEQQEEDPSLNTNNQDNSVGAQWRLLQRQQSSFDLTAQWKDSGVRPGVRYRLRTPLSAQTSLGYYQKFFYGKDGWESASDLVLDRRVSSSRLLRWRSSVDSVLETEEVTWRTVFQSRYVPHTGIGGSGRQWFMGFSGRNSGGLDDIAKNIGVTLRRPLVSDYLWFEIEPKYTWDSDLCQCDTASLQLSFELLLFDPS